MRRTICITVALLATLALVACEQTRPPEPPEPPADWTLRPLELDTMPGGGMPTDAAFPMRLADDAAGGFWGVSGDAWVHVDADGETADRFNYDALDGPWEFAGFDAFDASRLVISRRWADRGYFGELAMFDPHALTTDVVHHEERAFGDLAVHAGEIVYLAYDEGTPGFEVMRFDPSSAAAAAVETLASLAGDGATAAIDVDAEGRILVASDSGRVVIDAAGQATLSPAPATEVAVGESGEIAWVGDAAPDTSETSRIDGGSELARDIIAAHSDCAGDHVTVQSPTIEATLPFLCDPRGIVWMSGGRLVVSVGDEGGAPLVEVGRN